MRGFAFACTALACVLSAGCMTVSENGLYKEFRSFGFSRSEANCMVQSLEMDLSQDELSALARAAPWVGNDLGRRDVLYALMRKSDKRVKGALADAGNECLAEEK